MKNLVSTVLVNTHIIKLKNIILVLSLLVNSHTPAMLKGSTKLVTHKSAAARLTMKTFPSFHSRLSDITAPENQSYKLKQFKNQKEKKHSLSF